MNFEILPSTNRLSDESNQLHELTIALVQKYQKRKRQETLNQRRFLPTNPRDSFHIIQLEKKEDPILEIKELEKIINDYSISNSQRCRLAKKSLSNLRDIFHDNEWKIKTTTNFKIYLEILKYLLNASVTDLVFESVWSLSSLSYFDCIPELIDFMIPLIDLIDNQEKHLNIYSANILMEKSVFIIGNLLCENNICEIGFKCGVHLRLLKLLSRNDASLLNTTLWALSNFLRFSDNVYRYESFLNFQLQKNFITILTKFESNSFLISEILWTLALISEILPYSQFFENTLLNKIIGFLDSDNLKILVPCITILANICQILNDNCISLLQNKKIQNFIENGLKSNYFVLKKEIVFMLSNFAGVNFNVAEFIEKNENLFGFLKDMFLDLYKNNYLDNIFIDLMYLFCNLIHFTEISNQYLPIKDITEEITRFKKGKEIHLKLSEIILKKFKF